MNELRLHLPTGIDELDRSTLEAMVRAPWQEERRRFNDPEHPYSLVERIVSFQIVLAKLGIKFDDWTHLQGAYMKYDNLAGVWRNVFISGLDHLVGAECSVDAWLDSIPGE